MDTRKLEIELFWQRSLFFAGFVAAAAIAFAEVRSNSPRVATVIASFGFVSSVTWVFAAKGSKYWQEAWETKLCRSQRYVVGRLFTRIEAEQRKTPLLSASRFSVTQLTIALGWYLAAIWFVLMFAQLFVAWKADWLTLYVKDWLVGVVAYGSPVAATVIAIASRVTTKDKFTYRCRLGA